MNVTTGRLVMALAAATCLLSLAMLEVVSDHAGVDRAIMMTLRPGPVERGPAWDTIAPPEAPDPSLDASHLTMAAQVGGVTVLTVDEKAGRLLSMNGTGHVLESEVGKRTVVMTEDRQPGRLAVLKPGDVIRIEPTAGEIREIVLLRHAWRQLESPDQ